MHKKINYLGVMIAVAIFLITSYLVFFFLNLRDTNYYAIFQGLGFFYLLAIFILITSIKGESLKNVFFKKDVSGHFGTKKGEKLPFAGHNIYLNLVYTILFAICVVVLISAVNPNGYLHKFLGLK